MLLIDAANVVGSRPDDWWRDRAAAAGRLVEEVRAATTASRLAPPVVLVLEGAARRGAEPGSLAGVEVVHAAGAGDEPLVALAEAASEPVTLVSADRGLAERCRRVGSQVVGPSWLLGQLRTDPVPSRLSGLPWLAVAVEVRTVADTRSSPPTGRAWSSSTGSPPPPWSTCRGERLGPVWWQRPDLTRPRRWA